MESQTLCQPDLECCEQVPEDHLGWRKFLIMIFSLLDFESEKTNGCKAWEDILLDMDMEEEIKGALIFIRTWEGSRKRVRLGYHWQMSAVTMVLFWGCGINRFTHNRAQQLMFDAVQRVLARWSSFTRRNFVHVIPRCTAAACFGLGTCLSFLS